MLISYCSSDGCSSVLGSIGGSLATPRVTGAEQHRVDQFAQAAGGLEPQALVRRGDENDICHALSPRRRRRATERQKDSRSPGTTSTTAAWTMRNARERAEEPTSDIMSLPTNDYA